MVRKYKDYPIYDVEGGFQPMCSYLVEDGAVSLTPLKIGLLF